MKLKSRLPLIAAEIPARVNNGIRGGAEAVAARAKVRVPDRPPIGEGLVEAIHVERQGSGYAVVAGDGDVFWGHLVEFGTSHSAPHPFLVPAAEEARDEVTSLVRASLEAL